MALTQSTVTIGWWKTHGWDKSFPWFWMLSIDHFQRTQTGASWAMYEWLGTGKEHLKTCAESPIRCGMRLEVLHLKDPINYLYCNNEISFSKSTSWFNYKHDLGKKQMTRKALQNRKAKYTYSHSELLRLCFLILYVLVNFSPWHAMREKNLWRTLLTDNGINNNSEALLLSQVIRLFNEVVMSGKNTLNLFMFKNETFTLFISKLNRLDSLQCHCQVSRKVS